VYTQTTPHFTNSLGGNGGSVVAGRPHVRPWPCHII